MIEVNGIYENGIVKLSRQIKAKKSVKVIVTFLDEDRPNESERLSIKDFSFLKSRERSKRFIGSFSDTVIEERRSEI